MEREGEAYVILRKVLYVCNISEKVVSYLPL